MLFASIRSALSEKRLAIRLEIRVLALCVNHLSLMLGNDTTSILVFLRLWRSTYNFPPQL